MIGPICAIVAFSCVLSASTSEDILPGATASVVEGDAGLAACILADTLLHLDPASFETHARNTKD